MADGVFPLRDKSTGFSEIVTGTPKHAGMTPEAATDWDWAWTATLSVRGCEIDLNYSLGTTLGQVGGGTGVQTNRGGSGHIERLFTPRLGNTHMATGACFEFCADALPFMSQCPGTRHRKLLFQKRLVQIPAPMRAGYQQRYRQDVQLFQ